MASAQKGHSGEEKGRGLVGRLLFSILSLLGNLVSTITTFFKDLWIALTQSSEQMLAHLLNALPQDEQKEWLVLVSKLEAPQPTNRVFVIDNTPSQPPIILHFEDHDPNSHNTLLNCIMVAIATACGSSGEDEDDLLGADETQTTTDNTHDDDNPQPEKSFLLQQRCRPGSILFPDQSTADQMSGWVKLIHARCGVAPPALLAREREMNDLVSNLFSNGDAFDSVGSDGVGGGAEGSDGDLGENFDFSNPDALKLFATILKHKPTQNEFGSQAAVDHQKKVQ